MSDQRREELSDKDKIDRAAWHEELRFLKKQQWAIATAGVLLLGGLLAAIRNMHLTALDRFLAVMLIAIGVYIGWLFLDDLQYGLASLRRSLDAMDREATVLLEAGSIVNRKEELELATPERRIIVAEAVTAAVEDFCARKGQTVADRPAAKPAGFIVTAPSQRIRPASFSR